jgi:hypothetical protein
MTYLRSIRAHLVDWSTAYVLVILFVYGLVAGRRVVAIGSGAILAILAVFTIALIARGRGSKGSDPAILSAPSVQVALFQNAAQELRALGLVVRPQATVDGALTELDLLGNVVEIPNGESSAAVVLNQLQAVLPPQVRLKLSEFGESFAPEDLIRLNASLPSQLGRFYYYPADENLQVVFLSPLQVQALSARNWRFQSVSRRLSNAA